MAQAGALPAAAGPVAPPQPVAVTVATARVTADLPLTFLPISPILALFSTIFHSYRLGRGAHRGWDVGALSAGPSRRDGLLCRALQVRQQPRCIAHHAL